MSVVVVSPSVVLSSTPVTVMVWGVFQLAAVKVSDEELSKTSEASSPVMVMMTFASGSLSRTTLNEDVDPPSVTRRLPPPSVVPVLAMVMPELSLSVVLSVVVVLMPL